MTLIQQALARIEEMEHKYATKRVTCGDVLILLRTDLPALCALVKELMHGYELLPYAEGQAALKAFVEGK